MSCLKLPKGKGLALHKVFRDFLWVENDSQKKKLPLVAWVSICKSIKDGGEGMRDLFLKNKALGAKLTWKIYSNLDTKWCQIMIHKYLDL